MKESLFTKEVRVLQEWPAFVSLSAQSLPRCSLWEEWVLEGVGADPGGLQLGPQSAPWSAGDLSSALSWLPQSTPRITQIYFSMQVWGAASPWFVDPSS